MHSAINACLRRQICVLCCVCFSRCFLVHFSFPTRCLNAAEPHNRTRPFLASHISDHRADQRYAISETKSRRSAAQLGQLVGKRQTFSRRTQKVCLCCCCAWKSETHEESCGNVPRVQKPIRLCTIISLAALQPKRTHTQHAILWVLCVTVAGVDFGTNTTTSRARFIVNLLKPQAHHLQHFRAGSALLSKGSSADEYTTRELAVRGIHHCCALGWS